jgi:hypothetical protein
LPSSFGRREGELVGRDTDDGTVAGVEIHHVVLTFARGNREELAEAGEGGEEWTRIFAEWSGIPAAE